MSGSRCSERSLFLVCCGGRPARCLWPEFIGKSAGEISYQELYDKSDLVVIAKPLSTRETTERTTLPNIAPDVPVIGLSTEFDVSLVMKGDTGAKKVTLYHYRLANSKKLMANGPMLVAFDPKQQTHFLLFLHREADGRYSPACGQTDPALFCVLRLEGVAQ